MKSDFIREGRVGSLEGDNLVVFYYLTSSEIFGGSGLIREVVFGDIGLING